MPKNYGKLQKKVITNKEGKRTTVYVDPNKKGGKGSKGGGEEDAKGDEKDPKEGEERKIGDRLKDWVRNQEDQFNEQDPDKEAARKSKNLLRRKVDGVVKALKHEVDEWKTSGEAVGKVFKGQKLSRHEKKAVRSCVLHAAFVAGTAAIGAGGAASFAKKVGVGFLEHTGILRGGQAMLFAKAEEGEEDPFADPERNLKYLIMMLAQYLEEEVQEKEPEPEEEVEGEEGEEEEEAQGGGQGNNGAKKE